MKKAWLLLALGIVAYLGFALVTLPANVVLSRLASTGVQTDGVSGTIWKGRAQVVRTSGAHLGSAAWDLHVLALFTCRLTAEVDLKRTDGFAKTLLTVTPSGRVAFENLVASLPLTLVPATINTALYKATINLKFAHLVVQDGWPMQTDGTLEAIDLTGPAQRPVNIGSYKIVFPPDASSSDVLAGALSDLGGPMEVTGTVQVKKADRSYVVEGLIKARPDAPPSFAQQLQYLERAQYIGPADAEGRHRFRYPQQ